MSNPVVPIMQFGATGPVVAEIQNHLRILNYPVGDAIGVYDSNTAHAISLFQRDAGLEMTGDADEATLSMLKARVESRNPTPKPAVVAAPEASPAGSKPVAPVVPLHPSLANSARDISKRQTTIGVIESGTALVPATPPPAQSVLAKPTVIAIGIIALAGLAFYAISKMDAPQPFEAFEDAEPFSADIDPEPEEIDATNTDDLRALAAALPKVKRKPRKRSPKAKPSQEK